VSIPSNDDRAPIVGAGPAGTQSSSVSTLKPDSLMTFSCTIGGHTS
jgi:hypothetical protein